MYTRNSCHPRKSIVATWYIALPRFSIVVVTPSRFRPGDLFVFDYKLPVPPEPVSLWSMPMAGWVPVDRRVLVVVGVDETSTSWWHPTLGLFRADLGKIFYVMTSAGWIDTTIRLLCP